MSGLEQAQSERGVMDAGGLALAPARRPEERALRSVVSDPVYLAGRGVRALLRQPWFVAITLVQPVVWLLLFGALFQNVVPAPNGDYIAYLTPGIVVMSALFSSGWAGMGFITDAERGVMDRLLVSPVRRGSVMTGSLVNQQVTTVVQTLVILALGFATGARFPGGVGIMLVFVGSVILLAAAFASYSNALALLLRSQESVIGAVNFVVLPLSFLSSMLVPTGSLPGWIAAIAQWNPVDWAVVIGRQTLSADVDWSVVGPRFGGLAVLAVVAGALAARSFASYQRSV
jgi:ABC-2 type transport system permease protein